MNFTKEEIEALYMPYLNHQQPSHRISEGVWYLGYWQGFGELFSRHRLWCWKAARFSSPPPPTLKSQIWQEKALDAALASKKLQDKVLFSTTPSYFSQFQSACLLKGRGFELLQGLCYKHPGYVTKSPGSEHPGILDRYEHWEHIWWKINGKAPNTIGRPTAPNQLQNCGIDSLEGLGSIALHDGRRKSSKDDDVDFRDRQKFLAVAWLPRCTPFPKGWRTFFAAKDYKLGVNFSRIANEGSKVQKCPHNFDLRIFDGWEPDFETWTPS